MNLLGKLMLLKTDEEVALGLYRESTAPEKINYKFF
jgi:hypothetical protein